MKTAVNRAVVLMGVCGSGKSTVGLALAEKCGGVFLDADDFHPQANIDKMRRGEPLDDADRAPWLARLAALLSEAGDGMVFLACSALKARYREILGAGRGDVRFVHLHGTPEVIRARLRARPGHWVHDKKVINDSFALFLRLFVSRLLDIDKP